MFRRLLCVCLHAAVSVGLAVISVGCASAYVTPGRGADMTAVGLEPGSKTDSPVQSSLDKRPLAHFPTAIAVVRVQSPGYTSSTAKGWGTGKFSIVTGRDIEPDGQVEKLAKLPMVNGIAPLNRLLLSSELNSDADLRQAAAALHAEMLLVYTLDTTFDINDKAAPLTVVTLGLSPNQVVHVNCTASAVLLDTRNGFVYGVSEATNRQSQLASAWTTDAAVDDVRRRVETAAFTQLVTEFEKTWSGVVREYAKPLGTASVSEP